MARNKYFIVRRTGTPGLPGTIFYYNTKLPSWRINLFVAPIADFLKTDRLSLSGYSPLPLVPPRCFPDLFERRLARQNQDVFNMDEIGERLDLNHPEHRFPFACIDDLAHWEPFWEDPIQPGGDH